MALPQTGTSLNNALPVPDNRYPLGVGTMRATITGAMAKGAEIPIGVLPANAALIGGSVAIVVVFNGTTPTMDIGFAGSAALNDDIASALVLTALANLALDDLAAAGAIPSASNRVVTVKLTGAGNTLGQAEVTILYSQ